MAQFAVSQLEQVLERKIGSCGRDQESAMREPRNRVVQVRRFDGPDRLEVVDAPLPTAGRGEVRVRVLASSVQYTDVLIRRHLYPQTATRRPPFVLGYDVVGKIDQLGDGVRGFQVGDRVADHGAQVECRLPHPSAGRSARMRSPCCSTRKPATAEIARADACDTYPDGVLGGTAISSGDPQSGPRGGGH